MWWKRVKNRDLCTACYAELPKIRRVAINVRVILASLAQQAYAQIVWQIRLLLMKHLRHFYIVVQFAI